MNPLEAMAIAVAIEAAKITGSKPTLANALRLAVIQSSIFSEAVRFARAHDAITEVQLTKLLEVADVAKEMATFLNETDTSVLSGVPN